MHYALHFFASCRCIFCKDQKCLFNNFPLKAKADSISFQQRFLAAATVGAFAKGIHLAGWSGMTSNSGSWLQGALILCSFPKILSCWNDIVLSSEVRIDFVSQIPSEKKHYFKIKICFSIFPDAMLIIGVGLLVGRFRPVTGSKRNWAGVQRHSPRAWFCPKL